VIFCATSRLCTSQQEVLRFLSSLCSLLLHTCRPFSYIPSPPFSFASPTCSMRELSNNPLCLLRLTDPGPWPFLPRNKMQTEREILNEEKIKFDANMARERNELSVQIIDLTRREAGLKIQINDFKRLQCTDPD
jgi:hypothetical protein